MNEPDNIVYPENHRSSEREKRIKEFSLKALSSLKSFLREPSYGELTEAISHLQTAESLWKGRKNNV